MSRRKIVQLKMEHDVLKMEHAGNDSKQVPWYGTENIDLQKKSLP